MTPPSEHVLAVAILERIYAQPITIPNPLPVVQDNYDWLVRELTNYLAPTASQLSDANSRLAMLRQQVASARAALGE